MAYRQQPLGTIQTNAYILKKNEHVLLIDPGDNIKKIISLVGDQLDAVLLTHAHWDHIGALDAVLSHYKVPVYLHEFEHDWLVDGKKNGSAKYFPEAITVNSQSDLHPLTEGNLSIGPFHLRVIETPGHSPGSCSFYWEEEAVVFAGDTLFERSIGRTDLYGGNTSQLLKSIQEKLLSLPDETAVAPGHGPETTIGAERQSNPFL
ncbi:MBL fold metallo-hydrolase [Aureibacillus halotolerans]|uniref:Glyoxylase-like metal-dependent hydrolase (Beta-lactamase superfamily II) n=1 Tax=Aureibacillus halotolerans TaxID=1508390 RepID=A0A4R6U9M0_9BACI|nr:MBL fold metallo-hydrolase [Aureibacillus halotolerans]TDQ41683.1 glyoxylase-like metal-dependent hydrolase (beta-lactamase superfamily II) [Aureibacillus halotolerans]